MEDTRGPRVCGSSASTSSVGLRGTRRQAWQKYGVANYGSLPERPPGASWASASHSQTPPHTVCLSPFLSCAGGEIFTTFSSQEWVGTEDLRTAGDEEVEDNLKVLFWIIQIKIISVCWGVGGAWYPHYFPPLMGKVHRACVCRFLCVMNYMWFFFYLCRSIFHFASVCIRVFTTCIHVCILFVNKWFMVVCVSVWKAGVYNHMQTHTGVTDKFQIILG